MTKDEFAVFFESVRNLFNVELRKTRDHVGYMVKDTGCSLNFRLKNNCIHVSCSYGHFHRPKMRITRVVIVSEPVMDKIKISARFYSHSRIVLKAFNYANTTEGIEEFKTACDRYNEEIKKSNKGDANEN